VSNGRGAIPSASRAGRAASPRIPRRAVGNAESADDERLHRSPCFYSTRSSAQADARDTAFSPAPLSCSSKAGRRKAPRAPCRASAALTRGEPRVSSQYARRIPAYGVETASRPRHATQAAGCEHRTSSGAAESGRRRKKAGERPAIGRRVFLSGHPFAPQLEMLKMQMRCSDGSWCFPRCARGARSLSPARVGGGPSPMQKKLALAGGDRAVSAPGVSLPIGTVRRTWSAIWATHRGRRQACEVGPNSCPRGHSTAKRAPDDSLQRAQHPGPRRAGVGEPDEGQACTKANEDRRRRTPAPGVFAVDCGVSRIISPRRLLATTSPASTRVAPPCS